MQAAALALVIFAAGTRLGCATPATDVEKYLAGLATWSADFTQTIDDGHGKVLRSAAGRLYLERPGKLVIRPVAMTSSPSSGRTASRPALVRQQTASSTASLSLRLR